KIIIAGIFRHYNETRRVGVARIFSDGALDTGFMDTAYNHFAGVPTHYFSPSTEPPNFVLASALQPDGNLIIGGAFTRVGGGGARDAISNRGNVARLIGGSTTGPGSIELAQNSYTADENGQTLFITMFRRNGTLG